jgi:cell division septal protein FtsQ
MLVKLGRQDALPRFKRFVAIYPKILQSSKAPIVSVDLRYPDGVAVQFGQIQKS